MTLIGIIICPCHSGCASRSWSLVPRCRSRGGLVASPWSSAVWLILGRCSCSARVIHARSKGAAEGGLWASVAFLHAAQSSVFPLFPVVDYQTFRRTHYDARTPSSTSRLLWVARGLVHLLPVQYHGVERPGGRCGWDLVQFMLGTFLHLRCRASSMIGHPPLVLVPAARDLAYSSPQLHELWRRINIY
jgi:hypothetical protein